jgi:hypothetical protein
VTATEGQHHRAARRKAVDAVEHVPGLRCSMSVTLLSPRVVADLPGDGAGVPPSAEADRP